MKKQTLVPGERSGHQGQRWTDSLSYSKTRFWDIPFSHAWILSHIHGMQTTICRHHIHRQLWGALRNRDKHITNNPQALTKNEHTLRDKPAHRPKEPIPKNTHLMEHSQKHSQHRWMKCNPTMKIKLVSRQHSHWQL